MSNDLTTSTLPDAATMESLIIGGDLSKLSPAQRVSYYQAVCKSLGLNPLTKPFDYITLNGKLTLYARKDAADQLRDNHKISIGKPDIQFANDLVVVAIQAHDNNEREDSDVGAVSLVYPETISVWEGPSNDRHKIEKPHPKSGQLMSAEERANAIMKAITKAKRRVTLSICGLGMLDETEVETIPTAKSVIVAETGEIVEGKVTETPKQPADITVDLAHLSGIVDSEGKAYLMMTKEELSNRSIGIGKALAKNGLTAEKKAEYETKQVAIKEILEWLANH